MIPAGPAAEAERVLRRLVTEVDERRSPRTTATVDQLLDRHFELLELELNTLATYRGLARTHNRPLIGNQKVGALRADMFRLVLRRAAPMPGALRPASVRRASDRAGASMRPALPPAPVPPAIEGDDPADPRDPQWRAEASGPLALDRDQPDHTGRAATAADAESPATDRGSGRPDPPTSVT